MTTTFPQAATTSRSATGYVFETAGYLGATPSNPAITGLRVTKNTLEGKIKTVTSNEIRADRQVTDAPLVDLDITGDLGVELSFQALADWQQVALGGTWVNNPSIVSTSAGVTISAVSTSTITVAAGGAAFVAGMLCLISGMPTATNNKLARVVSSTATVITFAAATFTAETATIPVGASVRVVGFQGASGDLVSVVSPAPALTSTVLNFTTLGLSVGQWVLVGDGDTAGNQFATMATPSWQRIAAIAANLLTFAAPISGATSLVADTGTGKTVSIFTGDMLINGTTINTFTIERQQLDTPTLQVEYFRGVFPDKLSYSLKEASIIEATISVIGKDTIQQQTRLTGVTDIAAPTYQVVNSTSNIGRFAIGGQPLTGINWPKDCTVDINNNLTAKVAALGVLGNVSIIEGDFTVSGAFTTYFGDQSLQALALANTFTSLDFRVGRADGNRESILIDLPAIKLTASSSPVSGKNQARTTTNNYMALRSSTLGYTASQQRFWYLPANNA